MAIRITTDSTSDLQAQVEQWGIEMMPLNVVLDSQTYLDGVNIQPADIFEFVE